MINLNKDELRELLSEVVAEHNRRIGDLTEEHSAQHEWLREYIEAEKDRKEMYLAIRNAVIGWSIPFILTALVVWFNTGHWIKP